MPDPITVYGLKTCDTTRKALKELNKAGLSPQLQDVREVLLTSDQIAEILCIFGDGAVNRASTTWRQMSETDRAAPPADLLARYPALLKRPVIRSGQTLTQGWSPAILAKLIGKP